MTDVDLDELLVPLVRGLTKKIDLAGCHCLLTVLSAEALSVRWIFNRSLASF